MTVGRVLITGGKGKTGRRVASRLAAMGIDVAIGTRTPDGPRQRRFHWTDPSSASAFDGCDAVYLVAPTDRTDHLALMQPLLQEAMGPGVRRFVLLSSSLLEPGDPMMGEVHAWLPKRASDWAVLRPSWFMQNFSEGPHAATIREEGIIYTATGAGRVGFIDAEDIAATAAASLTATTPLNSDVVLTGPEALSYDDTAAIITAALGRPVRHVSLGPTALRARLEAQGLRADYAEMLTRLDADIASGAEDYTTLGVDTVTKQRPTSFRAFANRVLETWV
jgi:uncharacterized protein YbjT (DUF2867 family)